MQVPPSFLSLGVQKVGGLGSFHIANKKLGRALRTTTPRLYNLDFVSYTNPSGISEREG